MKAAILGATGYAGAELARLLAGHGEISALSVSSVSFEGKTLGEVYPHLLAVRPVNAQAAAQAGEAGLGGLPLVRPEEASEGADAVFAALPAGVGEEWAAKCAAAGQAFIDLSADFRFGSDEQTYEKWYGKKWRRPDLHAASVYGLPECNREQIAALASSRGRDNRFPSPAIIGNPGCYPTAATLAALPALEFAAPDEPVIVDAASGITGAGRDPGRLYHFPEASGSMTCYKVGEHRHTPEIERNLGRPVVFTPHLAPMNRGILATVYVRLRESIDKVTLECAYKKRYAKERFVRVLPDSVFSATNRVRGSNFCDISCRTADIGGTGKMAVIVAALDNMVKGAAGQAVQNMNILFGFAETTGLSLAPGLF